MKTEIRHHRTKEVLRFTLNEVPFVPYYHIPSFETFLEYESAGFRMWWLPTEITAPIIFRRARRKHRRYKKFIEKLYNVNV